MLDKTNKNIEDWQKPFRTRGALVLVLLLAAGTLYLKVGFDYQLRLALETEASRANRAIVEIDSVNSNFFKSRIDIYGFHLGNHTDVSHDLLLLDHISFRVMVGPLLRKKFVLQDLVVEGVHYGTSHRQGVVVLQANEPDERNLIDRVASGTYSEIRNHLNSNPLKQLGSLLTGSNIHASLYDMHSKLKSTLKINQLKRELENNFQTWGRQIAEIASPQEIDNLRHQVGNLAGSGNFDDLRPLESKINDSVNAITLVNKKIIDAKKNFISQINDVDQLLIVDVNNLKDQLKLPALKDTDLSNQIFGPTILNYFERASYWIDLSRRTMRKGNRNDRLTTLDREREGTDVHFGKMATYPDFILYHGLISSEMSADPTKGTILGTITGLTSDPPIYGSPMTLHLEGGFPHLDFQNFKADVKIDHVGDEDIETLSGSIESFPVDNLLLVESGDLKFRMSKARASLKFDGQFTDNTLRSHVSLSFWNVEYLTVSRYQRIEDTINQAITRSSSFDLEGTLNGPLDKLQLELSSTLGKRLAAEIQSEFKHQIGAIEDDIKKYLLDLTFPEKEELELKFKSLTESALANNEEMTRNLQDLRNQAVQKIAANEKGNKARRANASSTD